MAEQSSDESPKPSFNAPKNKKSRKAITVNIRLYSSSNEAEAAEALFQFQPVPGNEFQYSCQAPASLGLSGRFYYQFAKWENVSSFITASQIQQLRELVTAKISFPSLKELAARKVISIQSNNSSDWFPEVRDYLNFLKSKMNTLENTYHLSELQQVASTPQFSPPFHEYIKLFNVFHDLGVTRQECEENQENQLNLVNSLAPKHVKIHVIPPEWLHLFQHSILANQLFNAWSHLPLLQNKSDGNQSSSRNEIFQITITLPEVDQLPKIVITSCGANPQLLPWKIAIYPLTSNSLSQSIENIPFLPKPQIQPKYELITYSVAFSQYLSTLFSQVSGDLWFEQNIWKDNIWKNAAVELKEIIKDCF